MKNEEFATALMLSALLIPALLISTLLLTGCSSDTEDATGIPSDEDVLELAAYTSTIQEETPTLTRAIPTGYAIYPAAGTADDDVSHIGVFMTTPDMTSATFGNFIYTNNKWNSLVSVKQGIDYYVYGYMPSNQFTCTAQKVSTSLNFSQGVLMEFGRMTPVSLYDLCIITGVQDITSDDDEISLTKGNFHYAGKAKESKNRVRLMFDHLFAAARMEMKIDEEYAKLRDIRLKEVTMMSSEEKAYMCRLKLYATGIRSTEWQEVGITTQDESKGVTLFSDADGKSLSPTEAEIFSGYCLPTISTKIVLKSKYDVYDKNGNLIRKDCTAENKLVLPSSAGMRYIFKLTVKPTYIYVLSDPDEEPPTVKIEN